MYTNSATVKDIYRLALPDTTRLLCGQETLSRPVTWACSLRPSPPAFPKLDGNEFALIDMEDLRRLDPQMRLERVVNGLRDARVAAIAVVGAVNEAAIHAAEASEAPLFQLPDDARLMQIERTIIRLIVDRAGYIAQRSSELQRELNRVALDGGGLFQVAEHVRTFVQAPCLFLREDGLVAASSGLEREPEARRQALLKAIPNLTALRSWAAANASENGNSPRPGILALATGTASVQAREAVAQSVLVNDSVRGYCLLLRPPGNRHRPISSVEQVAVTQGAAAAGLEWAKQNAVDVAEERMRATFVDEILAAEIADEQAWVQRGASLNYDLTRPHAAWMVEAQGIPDWPNPLLCFAEEQAIALPFSRRAEGVLLYWPLDNPKSGRELKAVANAFAEKMLSSHGNARLVIGIGRPAVGPATWIQSQQQARESWRLGKAWQGAVVTYFGDLGLYQLLSALGDNQEARRSIARPWAV